MDKESLDLQECIGFSVCSKLVVADHPICRGCWVSLSASNEGRNLRSAYLAANRRPWISDDTRKTTLSDLKKFLFKRIEYGRRRKENVREFTIVPERRTRHS